MADLERVEVKNSCVLLVSVLFGYFQWNEFIKCVSRELLNLSTHWTVSLLSVLIVYYSSVELIQLLLSISFVVHNQTENTQNTQNTLIPTTKKKFEKKL